MPNGASFEILKIVSHSFTFVERTSVSSTDQSSQRQGPCTIKVLYPLVRFFQENVTCEFVAFSENFMLFEILGMLHSDGSKFGSITVPEWSTPDLPPSNCPCNSPRGKATY